ncbi:MAG TPA: non-heme iron oxygenase ferredoxin subunit [Xanthobacteraceae bacterium]|nr:non-heme iron oxygenase ferredoxin subunit [Xanthobacteraceae bacterium]
MADNDWRRVASRNEIKQGLVLQAQFGDEPIMLTEIDGQIYAVSDTCTHEFALLSEGFLEGEEIECPLHQARFDVRTGRCLAGPAAADLMRFEVKVEGDDVYVRPAEPE